MSFLAEHFEVIKKLYYHKPTIIQVFSGEILTTSLGMGDQPTDVRIRKNNYQATHHFSTLAKLFDFTGNLISYENTQKQKMCL